MNDNFAEYKPRARENDVVVQELADDLVVYDGKTNQVHSLNGSAAKVWGLCDGESSIHEIAGQLGNRVEISVNEDIVWAALDHLGKAGLLTSPTPTREVHQLSRRKLMQKLAYAAVAVPVVTSMLAPVPSAAVSHCSTCTTCIDLKGGGSVCPAACSLCIGTCYTYVQNAGLSCSNLVKSSSTCAACDTGGANFSLCNSGSNKCSWKMP